MIAAAWRLQRLVVIVALAVVGAFAIWLAVTGTMQSNAWTTLQQANHGTCLVTPGSACAAAASNYYSLTHLSSVSLGLLFALPLLLGLLLGAPLVAREIEQRTNRMAWTQSITRTRWLFVKLGVGALTCVALVAALAPLVEWWTNATRRVPRIYPATFDVAGIVPIAYVLFAFVLGTALGALIRRPGWAFATGVPVYAGIRFLVRFYIRPDLVAPVTVNGNAHGYVTTGWSIHGGYVPIGRSFPAVGQSWQSGEEIINRCTFSLVRDQKIPTNAWTVCTRREGLHWVTQFQPPNHFWPLQGIEAAIFCVIALALVGSSVLAVRWWRT